MSRIFETLQQADAESEPRAETIYATVTQLIERAERRAGQPDGSIASAEKGTEARFSDQSLHSTARPGQDKGRSAAKARRPEENAGFPVDFRTVQLSVPYHDRLVSLADPSGPAAEAFRLLEVRLRQLRRDRRVKSLLISSTSPQEGKSMISANLACTLATLPNQKVLLIEGDMRRPSLNDIFQLESMPGLYDYLGAGCRLTESIAHLQGTGVWLMPAGKQSGNPLEALQSAKIPPMLAQLYDWFDWVLVDSPPVLPLADTSIWARLVDGIVVVARRGVSREGKLKRGLDAIDANKLVGAVLNSSTTIKDDDYSYYRRTSN